MGRNSLTELSDSELLQRFKPLLFYDSGERYFSCSVEAAPPAGVDYRMMGGARLEGEPELQNVIYGRVVQDDGGRWLQYWSFHLYNNVIFGNHSGDWEGVQYLLQGNVPILAAYAQHARGEVRQWSDLKWEEGTRPRVYVARGSHASYFETGWYKRDKILWERADGKHPLNPVDPRLVVMPEAATSWCFRLGTWGRDKSSPASPGHQMRWKRPSEWARYIEK